MLALMLVLMLVLRTRTRICTRRRGHGRRGMGRGAQLQALLSRQSAVRERAAHLLAILPVEVAESTTSDDDKPDELSGQAAAAGAADASATSSAAADGGGAASGVEAEAATVGHGRGAGGLAESETSDAVPRQGSVGSPRPAQMLRDGSHALTCAARLLGRPSASQPPRRSSAACSAPYASTRASV